MTLFTNHHPPFRRDPSFPSSYKELKHMTKNNSMVTSIRNPKCYLCERTFYRDARPAHTAYVSFQTLKSCAPPWPTPAMLSLLLAAAGAEAGVHEGILPPP